MPIAHGDGRYTADDDTLDAARGRRTGRVPLCDRRRRRGRDWNPNGSMRDIAGIVNDAGNVLGMMPHPERAVDPLLGSTDGLALFESILARVAA